MLSLLIEQEIVKNFMNNLFKNDCFDLFQLKTIEITASHFVSITEPDNNNIDKTLWSNIRPLILNLLKHVTKPTRVKIVFSYPNVLDIHANLKSGFINILYGSDTANITTGTSEAKFTLDKSHEAAWDAWVIEFFKKNDLGVVVE